MAGRTSLNAAPFTNVPCRTPALVASLAGAALLTIALFCFIAWNWHGMGYPVRLALPGCATLICLALCFLSEHKGRPRAASLALLASTLFIGLFWIAFGQCFQSGAPLWKLCRAWAVCTVPLFFLRREICLWYPLVLLFCGASCTEPPLGAWNDVHTSHLLQPLCVSAVACALALIPQVRGFQKTNAWLALPLTLLITAATTLCGMLIFYDTADYVPSLSERLAGPLTLAATFAIALYTRHATMFCALALSALALLNIALLRLFDKPDPVGTPLAFLAVNLAATLSLPRILFLLTRQKKFFPRPGLRAISALGGFLSALSFLALLFLRFADNPLALVAVGSTAALCGILLWRARRGNVFFSVLASVLASGGAANVHIALFPFPTPVLLTGVWTAALLFYRFMDAPALRFSAIFWALVTSATALPAGFPLTVPLFLFFFLPLVCAAYGYFPTTFLRPAAFACTGALLLLPALLADPLAFFLPGSFPLSLAQNSLEHSFMRAFALLCLAFLTRRILPPLPAPRWQRLGKNAAFALSLAIIWLFCPLEGLLFLNVSVAGLTDFFTVPKSKSPRDSLFTGAGLTLLALGLTLTSFLLNLSFPEKMTTLGIPGLWLSTTGFLLAQRALPKEPSPADVAPVSKRILPFTLCAVLLTIAVTWATVDSLKILRNGREILLPLSEIKVRSSILGETLELRYELDALTLPPGDPICLPLDIDAQGMARPSTKGLSRRKDCKNLKDTPVLKLEKTPSGATRARLPRRYAIEEGLAPLYKNASFARLRCDENGDCLLTGLTEKAGSHYIHPHR